MADFEWTNELVIRLVQEYQAHPELWDCGHESYRVQTLRYETWRELAAMFDCDIADLRKKLNSLFASHRREKGKVRRGVPSTWFLYDHLSFLPTHVDNEPVAPVMPQPMEEVDDVAESSDAEPEYFEPESPPTPAEVLIKEEPASRPRRPRPAPAPARPRHRPQQTHKPRLTQRPIKRPPKEYHRETPAITVDSQLDARLSEALKLLRRSDLTRAKDECDSFGEYIADSLRKHDERSQSMIKQAINNILFEQEMKRYSANNQYTVILTGAEENPLMLDGK